MYQATVINVQLLKMVSTLKHFINLGYMYYLGGDEAFFNAKRFQRSYDSFEIAVLSF